jgi:hypothetical protein
VSGFRVVIPARLASTRLPNKPLVDLAGKPMVVRVWERAVASGADEVWVATDAPEVAAAVEQAGGRAILTRADHASGTDRLAEVVERLGWENEAIVVNVQGDEPLIDPDAIRTAAQVLALTPEAAIATLAHPIDSVEEFFDPNIGRNMSICATPRDGRSIFPGRRCPGGGTLSPPGVRRACPRGCQPCATSVCTLTGLFSCARSPGSRLAHWSGSRCWSSCALCGTDTPSRSKCSTRPRRPASIRRRTWSGYVACSPGPHEDRLLPFSSSIIKERGSCA